jgi:hypothetical protein
VSLSDPSKAESTSMLALAATMWVLNGSAEETLQRLRTVFGSSSNNSPPVRDALLTETRTLPVTPVAA